MIHVPVIRPSAWRAIGGSWRSLCWLWFLRFLRRDLPKPIVYPVALLYAALHRVSGFWVFGWAVAGACFAYNGMWNDAAKAAFCALMVPAMCWPLRCVLSAYRWMNR